MNKEQRRKYMKAWQKANPDKMREYNRRAQERNKDTHNHHRKGRVICKKSDIENKRLFKKTAHLGKDKMTAYQFMRLSPEKIAKLDISKLRISV